MALRIRTDTAFFWLAVCTWLLFFAVFEQKSFLLMGVFGAVIFALAASSISYAVLKLFGYFRVLPLVPRKSDLLLVLVAFPIGGIIVCGVFRLLTGNSSLLGYPTILYGTPLLTLVVFGAHYASSKFLLSRGRKRKVVLDVLPFETRTLLSDFQNNGLDKCVEFLTRRDLQIRMRAGNTGIDLIIISQRAAQQFKSNPWLLRAHLAGIPIVDYKTLTSHLSGRCRLSDADLWSYVLSARPQTHFLRMYSQAKRIVEPVIAGLIAIVTLPVMLLVAVAIKKSSPGPVLYKQVRAGHKGRPFTLLKFRSMHTDSEKDGVQWARRNDNRVTKVGEFLRKTRLDELPQLWNVMKGDMSFCGPRPERPEIYARLAEEIPIFSLRTVVRPGITGWAQVCAGYAASVEESMLKLEYDLYYIQHMSPRLDLIAVLKTFWVAIVGDPEKPDEAETQSIAPKMTQLESSRQFEVANG